MYFNAVLQILAKAITEQEKLISYNREQNCQAISNYRMHELIPGKP